MLCPSGIRPSENVLRNSRATSIHVCLGRETSYRGFEFRSISSRRYPQDVQVLLTPEKNAPRFSWISDNISTTIFTPMVEMFTRSPHIREY